ncbi:MAG: hemerythrin domain-containing protein [Desulfobacterales bacterium]|jgi:hemerythrin-like domain-containing protein|nr:hemerythrin domain-containing protein [Desulfobacteraceae bacterium]MDD3992562.1 hemerythrin domain-containing protein [Desulfobacteraceae bacterium]MDY0312113.1 hemerythrin domain-containing protein [Desulfobacterales bacterium]
MKATEELKQEHEGIALMLRVMQAIAEKAGRGETLESAHLDGIIEFLTVFVDTCHHGKEEEFLFPALEAAGVASQNGPIGVLLAEHESGRKLVARLKAAWGRYGGGDRSAGADLQQIAEAYVDLLHAHITKENTVLFPMADARLDADTDARLFESFEKLERERIGVGTHEAFHTLLHNLRDTYLTA